MDNTIYIKDRLVMDNNSKEAKEFDRIFFEHLDKFSTNIIHIILCIENTNLRICL